MKRLKISTVFCGVLFLLLLLSWLLGNQTLNWYEAKHFGKLKPCIALIPQPLRDGASSQASGTKITDLGYEFEVPWPSPEKTIKKKISASYIFSGGYGLTFMPEPVGLIQMMKQPIDETQRRFISSFGARTDYELLRYELNMTPNQVSPFMWKYNSGRKSMLLLYKYIELPDKISAIYSFELNGVRGFQFGDPLEDHHINIIVMCFDSSDRELEFIFSVKPNATVQLTQSEINRVIQTLHATTASSN